MNDSNDTNVELHDPNHAVDDYLDTLLDDGVSNSEHALPSEQHGADTALMPDLQETGGLQPPATPDTLPSCAMGSEESFQSGDSLATGRAADEFPSQVKKTPEATAQIEVDVPSNARVADDSGAESQMPSAQLLALFKFQAMGVHFAVPAEQYRGDFPCAEDISSDQDGPEWVLGEIAIDGKRIRIANIAVMVIPNTRRDALRSDFRYRRVLQVGRGGWGFVCDGDVERIELSFEKVHWRTKQGKRQWLAGTIVDQKCALLDVSVIERVLDHGEWGE